MSLFKDLSKDASDLLTDDYNFNRKLKIKAKAADGVTVTAETVAASAGVLGKVSAKFSPAEGLTVKKLQFTTHERIVAEATYKVDDATTVHYKAQDGRAGKNLKGKSYKASGKLGVEYKADGLGVDAWVDVVNSFEVTASALMKQDAFLIGGKVDFAPHVDEDDEDAELTSWSVGGGYEVEDYRATLTFTHKGDDDSVIDVSFLQKLDAATQFAVLGSYSTADKSTSALVGGSLKAEDGTEYQARIDKDAKVAFNVISKLSDSAKLTTSVKLDAKDYSRDSYAVGFALALN
eukprot:PLAT4732.1.p2 GENE.PLAT4732.1~~PLAT4732.1.p2  ORF type:complete len:291 (-),score=155.77 PLAT4732.1:216-1088(-)